MMNALCNDRMFSRNFHRPGTKQGHEATRRKPGVLFLIDQIDAATGGTEQHLSFLLKNLPAKGYRVTLAVLRDVGFRDDSFSQVPPLFLGFDSFYHVNKVIKTLMILRRLVLEQNVGIVHTFFPDSEIIGIALHRLVGLARLVSARRNVGHHYSAYRLWIARQTSKFVPNFLANCRAVKEAIIRQERVRPTKVEVILNPLNRERLKEGNDPCISRGDFGFKETDHLVGMVANFRPVKGHTTLIRAARNIASVRAGVKFLLVGGGEAGYKEHLERLVRSMNLAGHVVFADASDNPISIMKAFDVGVLTSRSEGLSNTLIEYGACGLPAVVTDVGGNREIVKDGETGFVVPEGGVDLLAHRILELLDAAPLRARFGENARKFVFKEFDQDSIIDSYDRFYERLLGVNASY